MKSYFSRLSGLSLFLIFLTVFYITTLGCSSSSPISGAVEEGGESAGEGEAPPTGPEVEEGGESAGEGEAPPTGPEVARAWGTPQRIGIGRGYSPEFAVASNGNAIAVWKRSTGTPPTMVPHLWVNYYTAGTGWGEETTLTTGDHKIGTLGPWLAIDSVGNALIIWRQAPTMERNDLATDLWAQRFVVGSGLESPVLLASGIDSTGGNDPDISMNNSGNTMVVWNQAIEGEADLSIWSRAYRPGAGWGAPAVLSANDLAFSPQVAIDESGNAISVWMQTRSIWGNRFTPETGWGTPSAIHISSTGVLSWWPQIVIDGMGNPFAYWRAPLEGAGGQPQPGPVMASHFILGSGWETASPFIDIASDVRSVSTPEIVFATDGRGLAVWREITLDENERLVAKRYLLATGWEETATVFHSFNNAGSTGEPRISFENGSAFAVWGTQDDSILNHSWITQSLSGSGWSEPVELMPPGVTADTDFYDYNGSPQIGVDSNGNAILVWVHSRSGPTGENDGIWSNRYE